MLDELGFCFQPRYFESHERDSLWGYVTSLNDLIACIDPFIDTLDDNAAHAEVRNQLVENLVPFHESLAAFQAGIEDAEDTWPKQKRTAKALKLAVQRLSPLMEASRDLARQADTIFKIVGRLIEVCETELDARGSSLWSAREISRTRVHENARSARGKARRWQGDFEAAPG